MPTLIRNGAVVAHDPWRVIGLASGEPSLPYAHAEDIIVPLAAWTDDARSLSHRPGRTGIWLGPTDDPAQLAAHAFPALVAVHFPLFSDGRGNSTARLLRERYGYRGELRAIGDILRDQLYELARVGFDAFALRDDQDARAALRAFADFSEDYQAAADRAPLFVRRFGLEVQVR
ncbi:MAG: DUF934 domain-containing protein [Burkholderiales bacterium]|nr:DUF934 domain-containing protein [Burkholderiales bacterium]